VPLLEQKLLALPEFTPVLVRGVCISQSLDYYMLCFVDYCLLFWSLSFSFFPVCSSSIINDLCYVNSLFIGSLIVEFLFKQLVF
jgi:hypothetical protein